MGDFLYFEGTYLSARCSDLSAFFLLEIKFRDFWKLHCIPNFMRLSGSKYRQTTSENAVVIVITVECKRSRFLYHNKHIPSLWSYFSGIFSCGTVIFFCGSH